MEHVLHLCKLDPVAIWEPDRPMQIVGPPFANLRDLVRLSFLGCKLEIRASWLYAGPVRVKETDSSKHLDRA